MNKTEKAEGLGKGDAFAEGAERQALFHLHLVTDFIHRRNATVYGKTESWEAAATSQVNNPPKKVPVRPVPIAASLHMCLF